MTRPNLAGGRIIRNPDSGSLPERRWLWPFATNWPLLLILLSGAVMAGLCAGVLAAVARFTLEVLGVVAR